MPQDDRITSEDALYKALLDAAPDALIVVDQAGAIRIANQQAETLFGYRRSELIGQPAELLVPDALRSVHSTHRGSHQARPLNRPMGAGLKLSARRHDGSTFPVDISLSSIQTESGLLVAAAIRDITDRVALEKKFEGLLDAAPDAMVTVDEAGDIRFVNRQAESMFGYDRAELIGTKIERLIPQRVQLRHPGLRASYAADPQTRPMGQGLDLSAVRKDGTEFPVDIALSSIRGVDGLLISAAIRDMSVRFASERERRLIAEELHQARLRQAQRLETVGQLAGGIAHDFNNLLAVILNYADFLAEQLPEGQMHEDVEQIQRAGARAAELTRQLLIFARREVVKAELLDINAVVSGVEQLLRRTIGENVEFVTVLAQALPSVRADPGQLEQVFLNLAVNARDAMPGGGRLVVETSDVILDEDYADEHPGISPGRYVRLSVSDTGVGMDPETAARAFEPFFTTKPAGQGTGLGLATVYGIVTQAGGNARIYSEPGRGTLVSIHLPAIDKPVLEAAARDGKTSPIQGNGETILVVEDEPAVLLAAIRTLGSNGYELLSESTPSAALDRIADRGIRIDLLLTDVVMPGLSGIELARRARELRPELRVVFMSGYSHEVITRQGNVPTEAAIVQKPFTRRELLRALHETLLPAR